MSTLAPSATSSAFAFCWQGRSYWLPDSAEAESVSLLGMAESAGLIWRLFSQQQSGRQPCEIRLASPQLLAEGLVDPPDVLHRMRIWQHSPAVGGWHTMRGKEALVYQKLATVRGEAEPVRDDLWERQPWALVAAFGQPVGWSAAAAAQLAMHMIDPRWWKDPEQPNRPAVLYAGMGFRGRRGEGAAAQRLEGMVALRADSLAARANAVLAACGMPECVTRQELRRVAEGYAAHPRGFLWRAYLKFVSAGASPISALATCGRIFLRLLSDVWLDWLWQPAGNEHRRYELFVPEHFFPQAEDAVAWRKHVAEFYGRGGSYRE